MGTLHDVSRISGLSIATVSKYLNGIKVKPQNEEKIKRAIEESNYSVNFFAKSLKTKRSMTVGVLIPNMASAFYSSVISRVEQIFAPKGYNLLVSGYANDGIQENSKFLSLLSRKVDALLVAPERLSEQSVAAARANGTPVLFYDTKRDIDAIGSVVTDNYDACKAVTARLIESGFSKITVLLPSTVYSTTNERRQGCLDAAAQLGCSHTLETLGTPGDISGAYERTRALLAAGRPEVIFALSSSTFLGALMAVSDAGLKIPEDIAFIGYDNKQISKIYTPNISLVYQPVDDIAQAIYGELSALMAGDAGNGRIVIRSRITYTDSIRKFA